MQDVMMVVVVAALLGAASPVTADTLGPGMKLPALTLADQHGESGSIGTDTAVVLFTRDMKASKVAKEALADDGARLLNKGGVVYIAEISRMPGFVSRFFAVPAMRRLPYSILLDRDGKATADFPSEDEHVALIYLDALTIERVEHLDSAWRLRRALRAATARRAATIRKADTARKATTTRRATTARKAATTKRTDTAGKAATTKKMDTAGKTATAGTAAASSPPASDSATVTADSPTPTDAPKASPETGHPGS